MPAGYTYIDDATGTVAAPGRLEGGATIPLADASAFPAGIWPKPARLVVRRGDKLRTILKATGRSGSSITVDGPLDGRADKDLAAGDVVAVSWTAGDVGDLWSALDAVETTPGPPGTAATVAIGTVTTLPPGSPATAVNSGTSSAAVIDLGIPAGQGSKGDPGTAATVAVGTVSTGAPGSAASVTNVGTSSAAILDFAIPAGQTGTPGADGAAATVAVGTTTTGAAGSSASVTNSGTSSAAVLNFTIPRGADGAPGPNTVSGLIAVSPDGPLKIISGDGAPGNPYVLAVKRIMTWTFEVASGSAGTVGDMGVAVLAPWACAIKSIECYADVNPTSAVNANVKAGGVNVHATGLTLAGGSTGPHELTSGFTSGVIAKGTKIVAATTSLPSDARTVRVVIVVEEV